MAADSSHLRSLPDLDPLARQEVMGDIGKLSALPSATTSKLFQDLVAFLGDPKKDLLGAVDAVAAESKGGLDQETVRCGVRGLFRVAEGALRRGATADDIRHDLMASGLTGEAAATASTHWVGGAPLAAHRSAIAGLPGAGEHLVDLQWSLGVAVATNETIRLGETFVRLRLTLQRPSRGFEAGEGEDEQRHVWMELTVPQFFDILAELERARSVTELLGGVVGDDGEDGEEGGGGSGD